MEWNLRYASDSMMWGPHLSKNCHHCAEYKDRKKQIVEGTKSTEGKKRALKHHEKKSMDVLDRQYEAHMMISKMIRHANREQDLNITMLPTSRKHCEEAGCRMDMTPREHLAAATDLAAEARRAKGSSQEISNRFWNHAFYHVQQGMWTNPDEWTVY